jgi:RNA polymerase sigma-70 factor (ECF subfamily)
MSAIAIAWPRLALSGKTAELESTEPGAAASDRALIAAVAAGDGSAMQLLYSRHSVRVFRFISRIVKNPQLAEDLVSEVFLDVWRSARSFRGKSQVLTWLLSIARHKAFSALRRRCDEQLDDAALAMVEDPEDDPEMVMDKEHLSVIVRKCLAQLSPAHREVLDLVYYHDKSIDEIAEIIGIPATTVKTRAFYARSHMEKFLKSAGVAAL